MPKGIHIRHDLEAMIELVIRERRIALPTSRLYWYAKWFGLACRQQTVTRVCREMEKAGKLKRINDGKFIYWKNRR